jgi:hypothetical protein
MKKEVDGVVVETKSILTALKIIKNNLKIVLEFIDEYFEIVESDKPTNADRIRNMSDEELAEFLTTVTSDAICGSSWDYDGWIKELQSEAE